MTRPTYDMTSTDSILKHARKLTGKTLRDFLSPEEVQAIEEKIKKSSKNKGMLGNLVQKYYFDKPLDNSPLPDFPEAGIELKAAGVIPSTGRPKKGPLPITPSAYQSKERLKLAKINFMKLGYEEWEDNSLFKKCACILLLLSLYDEQDEIDRLFIAEPILWRLSGKDMEFIMSDWETIVAKIKAGKADELSGSDTYYLEASTSGTSKMVSQPFSPTPAKERSFAFKSSFVDASFLRDPKYVKHLPSILSKGEPPKEFESVVLAKLRPFEGKEVHDIASSIGYTLSKAKHYLALLSYRMLGVKSDRVEEFLKAGIQIKTVNLEPNGTPGEDMSFPAFSYMDIVHEEWEDSMFKQKLDTKTLLIVFQTDKQGIVTLKQAMFWSMNEVDMEEAHRVWEETRRRVQEGHADKLPRKAFSNVAHVRNHGSDSRNRAHHIPSPKNGLLPVMGFWLNQLYIKQQLS